MVGVRFLALATETVTLRYFHTDHPLELFSGTSVVMVLTAKRGLSCKKRAAIYVRLSTDKQTVDCAPRTGNDVVGPN
jgi:hypothetical protein